MLLTEKIEKAHLVDIFFACLKEEIPAFFSNWEPGAQLRVAHAYYVFRSEYSLSSSVMLPQVIAR